MGKVRDLTGSRFGSLIAIEPVGQDRHKNVIWRCLCDCGRYHETSSRSLVNGSCKSCGCMKTGQFRNKLGAERHGGSDERLYRVWTGMLNRCLDENKRDYHRYGGRGITVCDGWRDSYAAFREWAYANGYNPSLSGRECSLDRIDADGDYCPSNCRWVSMSEQAWNKQSTVWLDYRGKRITYKDAFEIGGISASTIRGRLSRGWSVESAVETPARRLKSGNVSRLAP